MPKEATRMEDRTEKRKSSNAHSISAATLLKAAKRKSISLSLSLFAGNKYSCSKYSHACRPSNLKKRLQVP